MLTLYTAVGILRFEDCLKNHKTPIVINNHREYGLSEEEFILWSCLAFHIRQIHELHTAFSERLKLHNRSYGALSEPTDCSGIDSERRRSYTYRCLVPAFG